MASTTKKQLSRKGDSLLARCLRSKDKVLGDDFYTVAKSSGILEEKSFSESLLNLHHVIQRVKDDCATEEEFMKALTGVADNPFYVVACVAFA